QGHSGPRRSELRSRPRRGMARGTDEERALRPERPPVEGYRSQPQRNREAAGMLAMPVELWLPRSFHLEPRPGALGHHRRLTENFDGARSILLAHSSRRRGLCQRLVTGYDGYITRLQVTVVERPAFISLLGGAAAGRQHRPPTIIGVGAGSGMHCGLPEGDP